ncbi:centrosome-associated protein 350 isoform X2 [Pungitius pungitius]|uniref:centrosome-associated protein 350 isoform X2 n=1 Tax=Pungitius pungitius TaxID=134920 RepID=UPI002E1192B8
MREMRSSRRAEASLKKSAQQLTAHNIGTELTNAWKGLSQSKAALRHIENRLEAAPGTGVVMDSVMEPPKKKSSRTVRCKGGQQADDPGGSSKRRGRYQQSPEKSSSRSPLRNATQDSNVRRNNSVEFRDPLASYREATPPPHPSSPLEAYSLQSVPGSSHQSFPPPSDPPLSQLVYQRDTRDKQTDRDLDSTHSSALESTEVRYLNDQPALDTLRTIGNRAHLTSVRASAWEEAEEESAAKAHLGMDRQESSPCLAAARGSTHRTESTHSSSPGSASQRLENLRRHQPDDKLEKLKERIQRQRQHLEESAEREKLLGSLEQPVMAAVGSNNGGTSNMPTALIRKVAAAPPAPIYKGFNSTETKIRTADGRVWKEEEFHNLSREIYRDLSRQFAESTLSRQQQQREQSADGPKERRPTKPVRKVHRAAPSSGHSTKPAISPASWREGQKLVKMVLGPVPRLPREEERSPSADRLSRTASRHPSNSAPRSQSNPQPCPNRTERPQRGSQSKSHSTNTSTPSSADQDKAPGGVVTDLLPADIQGILDDLQLECKAAEREERSRQRSRGGTGGTRGRGGSGSRTRAPVSAWGSTATTGSYSRGCRSASPAARRPETADAGQKKRHYDADTVRQYISRQQEQRKRRRAEEKRQQREESESRNQRLQDLYRKQKEAAKAVALPSGAPVAPVQKRLQETYTKLLLEEAQLDREASGRQLAAPFSPMQRPMYQPSGESDKENKRLEAPQSPSSSDRSLNEQPPAPLSRTDLDIGVASLLQPDRLSPQGHPTTGPSGSGLAPFGDPLLSQLLRLETALAASDLKHAKRPATAPSNRSTRIEALKATAASLSNRIESEARKLAGEGINYGMETSIDRDAIRPFQDNIADGCWAESTAPENDDVALRIQRILTSTGHSSYNGTALPGAGNLHASRREREEKGTHTILTNPQTTPVLNSYAHLKGRLVNGLDMVERVEQRMGCGLNDGKDKNRTDLHDSSAGSISEGPLLSEGSFSEDDPSPPQPSHNRVPRSADRLMALDRVTGQRRDYQRLSEFQREAAKCSALGSPAAQHDGGKAAWEELNKGSPLSVINIFTKNLHGHVAVSERNSPSAHSLHSASGPVDAAVYEDDFVSSHSSGASGRFKRGSNSRSVNSHFEELMRRSPYDKSLGGTNSHHSSFHSSIHSPHLSSGSTSGSLTFSKHSARKRGTASDQSDGTLVGEQKSPCSPPSEELSSDSRKRGSDKSSHRSQTKSVASNDTTGEQSGLSQQSLGLDSRNSPAARPKQASPSGSPYPGSPPQAGSPSEPGRSASLGPNYPNTGPTARNGRAEPKTTGELHYSPAVLQQRMVAELEYLESYEESVRHLGDVERVMGVSMAQQESVSLAQMLKARQECHARDLYELKIKAEREALETQLQLEENRQRVARAHIELQENLATNQKETLKGLQEATTKLMTQQAETARYTADTARHIKEMTELAQSQITRALIVPADVSDSSGVDREEQHSSYSKQQNDKNDSDSFPSDVSSRKTMPEEPLSSLNSPSISDSLSFRRPDLSGADSGSQHSLSRTSPEHRERTKKEAVEAQWRKGGTEEKVEREAGSSSIEEEVLTAANDSVCSDSMPSVVDEKADSTSVATEYSLKFDESMTEDEIEERSFRSLLPSEAHRRGTMEKKSRHHEESEDDGSHHNTTLVPGAHSILKSHDANMAFSGGQDSFSQFTMDMVRQYMKDEEVRLQHQSSLLHLRQKAVKEKTRTELAWLEHQKKRLRDKGEDDKMPPIRKKQRGLLMKLQQEQAEIRRLQEANKAARKERQLLLKQQEEIERMRNSTLRLKERLKYAGDEVMSETPVSETPVSEAAPPNPRPPDDVRCPSPSHSISGSETSSIMQRLKKMRSHMDEKHCSPVHYFLSVFTAHQWASLSVCLPNLHPKFQLFIYNQLVRFLTKREQQLMQRRHHAEELLQWKQRLDREEAEVHRMEKEALAVWDGQTSRAAEESQEKEVSDISPSSSHHRSSEHRADSDKEFVSEADCSSATPGSSIHTEGVASQQPGSMSSGQPVSIIETPLASVRSSHANYTPDFTSASRSPSRQSPLKGSHSSAASPSDYSSKTKMELRPSSRTTNPTQPSESLMPMQAEPISDQSDIESRIKALKGELRKRKFMAYQLKKEQKKRNKERLKAKEASLLKQLESYNTFIEKTKAELNKEPDSTTDTTSQIEDSTSIEKQTGIKPPAHRSEAGQLPQRTQSPSLDHNALPHVDHSGSTSVPEEMSDEEPPTVTPTPVCGSPECRPSRTRSHLATEELLRTSSKEGLSQMSVSGAETAVSYQRVDIRDELEVEVSSPLEDQQQSERLLKLEKEDRLDSGEKLSASKHLSSHMSEGQHSPSVSIERDKMRETSKAEEAVKSNIISNESHSATSSDRSCSPNSVGFSSNKEATMKDVEDSSPIVDGYHHDFESSLDSTPRQVRQGSGSPSQISVGPAEIKSSGDDVPGRAAPYDSHDEEVEEELAEEPSPRSGSSEASVRSARLLDLHNHTEDSRRDDKDIVNSTHSPPILPVGDEMPSFSIADRVLVGGVQPGTLRFKGPTRFANGFWAGVELDKSEGSNNGTYDGVVYFECDESHGIFAPPDKITHLPDKFEIYTDTTEDEDSFFDGLSDKGGDERQTDERHSPKEGSLDGENEQTYKKVSGFGDKNITDESVHKNGSHLNSSHYKESKTPVSNGNAKDIMLDFEEAPTSLLISDIDKIGLGRQSRTDVTPRVERKELDSKHQFVPGDLSADIGHVERDPTDRNLLETFADKFLNNCVKDTLAQFAEIKKAKEKKIEAANQMNGDLFGGNVEEEEWLSSVQQKDGLPFFIHAEKEELSSPELCNRPESPVLGASGQEELAKRLAELELSRELLDELGDEQDWFDEDFGLSSRREQQRLKQMEEEEEERLGGCDPSVVAALGGLVSSSGGEQQAKTPPRPELPLPLPPKLPEQPAMVVPHSAAEVEKMVHAAAQEIWESCGLGREGALALSQLPSPKPSQGYLGKDASGEDPESLCVRSYRKAVYDLTWEMLEEIYTEDPNVDQPQWVKPRRVKSSFFHGAKTPGDLSKVQEFISAEVLKMYGLTKDHSQKTDWQKMLKFGKKTRDRVDHILVQELHEEEAQWVNYDEDELFVKMQLADSIFDALLKDTANVLTLIYDKRAKRENAPS